MAVLISTLDSGAADTGGGATFNTASLGSGTGVTRFVSIQTYGASGITSITGDGLTYTQVATVANPDDSGVDLWLWRGTGNPTAGALTVTIADTGIFYSYVVDSATGANTTSPVVQSATNSGVDATPTASLAAFGSASNAAYAFVATNSSGSATPGTGFSELTDFGGIFSTYLHSTEWRASADTTPDMTLGGAANWGIIAVEVAEATAGGGQAKRSSVFLQSLINN